MIGVATSGPKFGPGTAVPALSAACVLVLAAFAMPAGAATKTLGSIEQLPGTAGCVSGDGSAGCADGRALDGATAVAVSPDGNNVYVASSESDAVVALSRDSLTGELTQLPGTAGCVSGDGTGGDCAVGRALDGATAVAVSPDGNNVYVASHESDAVAVFKRNDDGSLTQLDGTAGCVSDDGTGGDCAVGRALDGATSVAVSPAPDGQDVYIYVASHESDAVAVFKRNDDGSLTQLSGTAGCISDTGSAGCADGRALDGALAVTISPDGLNAYVAANPDYQQTNDALAVFDRLDDGSLSQKAGEDGCIHTYYGEGGQWEGFGCRYGGVIVNNPSSVMVSPDGRNLYYGFQSGVATRARLDDGRLDTPSGAGSTCVGSGAGGMCQTYSPLSAGASGVTVSPDGESIYATADNIGKKAVALLQRNVVEPEDLEELYYGYMNPVFGEFGCVVDESVEPDNPDCANDGRGLRQPSAVAVSPDGNNVYVASSDADGGGHRAAVAAFSRLLPRPPRCTPEPVTVRRDIPTRITLNCTDPEGDPLTYAITGQPQHGTLSDLDPAAATVTYTPDPGYPRPGVEGRDSFVYAVGDGTYEGSLATRAIQTIIFPAEPVAGGEVGQASAQAKSVAAKARIFGRTLRLGRRGRVRVGLRCHSARASCTGTLTLKTDRRRNRKSGKRVRKLTLGRAGYSIPAGKTKRVRVRIRKSGRRLLRRQARRRPWVWVKATAKTRGQATTATTAAKRTILLRAPRKARHRKRGRR